MKNREKNFSSLFENANNEYGIAYKNNKCIDYL